MNQYATPGSPLLARQDVTLISMVLIITVSIIAALLLIWIIYTRIHASKLTPEYAEKQRHKPTKLVNVNNVVEMYNFTRDDRNFLWNMCQSTNAPNLEYLVKDEDALKEYFEKYYKILMQQPDTQGIITSLFQLLYKFEKAHAAATMISSSKNIPEGTVLILVAPSGRQYSLKVQQNTKDGLLLLIPRNLYNSPDKPADLSKVELLFSMPSGMEYEINTRLVRYETSLDGALVALVTHSNNIIGFSRRQTKRIKLHQKTVFSAVKVSEDTLTGQKKYQVQEHRYPGYLDDISGGGCQLITKLPIKKDQYIWIEIHINENETDNVIGLIVNTKKKPEIDEYHLHIKFVQITQEVQNRIFAKVYNFSA